MRDDLSLLAEQLIHLAERDSARSLPDPERPALTPDVLVALAEAIEEARRRGERRGYGRPEMETRSDLVLRAARAVAGWKLRSRWADGFDPDAVQGLAEMERGRLDGLAQELRAVVERLLSAAGPAEESEEAAPPAVAGTAPEGQTPVIDREALAIALLVRHPDWGAAEIADKIGVSRGTLYRMPQFRAAAEPSGRLKPRGGKSGRVRRGHKSRDGAVEAYGDRQGDDE